MNMIACHALTKKFGDFVAADAMEFEVAEGEMFGFLGPNGAGKTTTIKMMTGLLNPSSGSAEIGGFNIQKEPLKAKAIFGYIPDNPFLYEKLTGCEYLDFIADLYSVSRNGRNERIADLLKLFELHEKGNELIQGYSRGMRQKIALAGALIHQPKVIFLDEPTVGLDPRGARVMQDILRELCHRGTTVFMSTHILEVAERMCDRIAIVNRGRMIVQGTMLQIRERLEEKRLAEVGIGSRIAQPGLDLESEDALRPQSLEEIFLELTEGETVVDPLKYLG